MIKITTKTKQSKVLTVVIITSITYFTPCCLPEALALRHILPAENQSKATVGRVSRLVFDYRSP